MVLENIAEDFSDSRITYINMAMEEISQLQEEFDIVISSLAFHYIEDFEGVIKAVYNVLDEKGIFIFSQENPLCTCHSRGERWTRDEHGNKLYLNLKDYGVEGERESVWFVDKGKKIIFVISSGVFLGVSLLQRIVDFQKPTNLMENVLLTPHISEISWGENKFTGMLLILEKGIDLQAKTT